MWKVQILVVGVMLFFMMYTIKVGIDLTIEELNREFEKDRQRLGLVDKDIKEVK